MVPITCSIECYKNFFFFFVKPCFCLLKLVKAISAVKLNLMKIDHFKISGSVHPLSMSDQSLNRHSLQNQLWSNELSSDYYFGFNFKL